MDVRIKALLTSICALVVLVGITTWQLSTERQAHLRTKAEHAAVLRNLAEKTAAAHKAVAEYQQAVSAELAQKDQQHTKELSHARTENDRLRTAARTAAVRVRVKDYDCTASASAVPAPTFSGSLGDGRAATHAAFQERVFDLRDAVITTEAQIKYLQDYARICQKMPEATP